MQSNHGGSRGAFWRVYIDKTKRSQVQRQRLTQYRGRCYAPNPQARQSCVSLVSQDYAIDVKRFRMQHKKRAVGAPSPVASEDAVLDVDCQISPRGYIIANTCAASRETNIDHGDGV